MPNELLYLLLVIIIAAIVLWAITQFPLDPTLARIVRIVVVVFVLIYVIYALFGLIGAGSSRHHASLRMETSSLWEVPPCADTQCRDAVSPLTINVVTLQGTTNESD